MTRLNDLGRRSFLKIAAALGGASTVGALPNLASAIRYNSLTPQPRRCRRKAGSRSTRENRCESKHMTPDGRR
jgi:hypothetical protein